MSDSPREQFRPGPPPAAHPLFAPKASWRRSRPGTLAILFDNPILWKHVRARLRPQHVLPAAVVVFVLSLCILGAAFLLRALASGVPVLILLIFQSAILLLLGTSQVATAVVSARESHILDFHRISPVPASWLALGFLLGAPIREYCLFACTLPVALFLSAAGGVPFVSLASMIAALLLNTLLCHVLGLVVGLVSVSRGTAGGAVIVVVLAYFLVNPFMWDQTIPVAFLTAFPVLEMVLHAGPDAHVFMRRGLQMPPPSFYGWPLGVEAQTLLYQTPVFLLLWFGAVRKMRKESAPLYSKPLAVAFLTVIAGLTMGGLWDFAHRVRPEEAIIPVVIVLYILTTSALFLARPTTPGASERASGLRRAGKLGLSRLSYWNDLSPNYMVLGCFCCVLFASAVLTMSMTNAPLRPEFWLTSIVAVLTVTHSGLARQYFALAVGSLAQPFLRLFSIMTWLLPLLIGLIVGMAGFGEGIGLAVVSLSPIVGIGVSAFPPARGHLVVFGSFGIAQLTALGSAVTLASLFTFMTFVIEARIHRWFPKRV